MKNIFNLFVLLISINFSYGQTNLVPNPSFELYDTCPSNIPGSLYLAIPWHSPNGGTTDYFNSCAVTNTLDVPNNFIGFQNARTGVAYAGMVCYDTDVTSHFTYREYLQVELIDSLIPQKIYCIKFFVSLTYNSSNAGTAISQVGMYISNNSIAFSNGFPLIYSPQIISPSGIYLTDTVNWMEVSGIYIAHGGERYITIGNFKWNINTDTAIQNNNSQQFSYYYVDDISVVACNVGVNELGMRNEELSLFPNPTQGELGISVSAGSSTNELGMKEVRIYDILGNEVLRFALNDKSVTIDVSELATGMYFIEAHLSPALSTGNRETPLRKKFVKQ